MVIRTVPQARASERDDLLTRKIIACAIEVHKKLEPGLPEKLFKASTVIEMELYGLKVEKNVKIPLEYKGKPIDDTLLISSWKMQ